MKVRQVLTEIRQTVSLPTTTVINGSPSKIAAMLIDHAGYPDLRNMQYTLIASQGDTMNFVVTGQAMIAQSIPDEDPAVPEEVQPVATVVGDTVSGD
jgi:hypothetical protein